MLLTLQIATLIFAIGCIGCFLTGFSWFVVVAFRTNPAWCAGMVLGLLCTPCVSLLVAIAFWAKHPTRTRTPANLLLISGICFVGVGATTGLIQKYYPESLLLMPPEQPSTE